MNRREFLQKQLQAIAYLSVGSSLLASDLFAPKKALAAIEPDVTIVKGTATAATRGAVEALGGIKRFVQPGNKVVIKPNISFSGGVESATTTNPEVVRELVVLCKEAGASSIRVLDHAFQSPDLCMRNSMILDACNTVEQGICHHLQHEEFYQEAQIPNAVEMHSNHIMKDALEADVIIAAPVAKTHGAMGLTMALKGQMGLIYDRMIMHSRYSTAVSIVDLNMLIKPHLSVIDCTRVLSTNGPGGPGHVINAHEVVASADPVAADSTVAARYEWYGRRVKPRQVPYLPLAHARGLGRMDIENLTILELSL